MTNRGDGETVRVIDDAADIDAARVIDPALKALIIAGFAENAAVGSGHPDAGMSVITKPFTNAALINKVREIIHSE